VTITRPCASRPTDSSGSPFTPPDRPARARRQVDRALENRLEGRAQPGFTGANLAIVQELAEQTLESIQSRGEALGRGQRQRRALRIEHLEPHRARLRDQRRRAPREQHELRAIRSAAQHAAVLGREAFEARERARERLAIARAVEPAREQRGLDQRGLARLGRDPHAARRERARGERGERQARREQRESAAVGAAPVRSHGKQVRLGLARSAPARAEREHRERGVGAARRAEAHCDRAARGVLAHAERGERRGNAVERDRLEPLGVDRARGEHLRDRLRGIDRRAAAPSSVLGIAASATPESASHLGPPAGAVDSLSARARASAGDKSRSIIARATAWPRGSHVRKSAAAASAWRASSSRPVCHHTYPVSSNRSAIRPRSSGG
jgi:hypothetical protein